MTLSGLSAATAGCLGSGTNSQDNSQTPPPDAVESLPAPTLGDADAPHTLTVYSDFGCPHCRDFHQETLPELESGLISAGQLTYQHGDFPLPANPQWSRPAALAARAVQDRGSNEAFWAFAEEVYANQDTFGLDLFRRVADSQTSTVNGSTVIEDVQANRHLPVVEASRETGAESGVTRTPGVILDGELLTPSSDRSYVEQIQQALN